MVTMRAIVAVALLVTVAGCRSKTRGEEPRPATAAEGAQPRVEEPNRDPYRNVTPQKVKERVEAAQKREDEHNDRVLEQAK